jgi:hypothetical protein
VRRAAAAVALAAVLLAGCGSGSGRGAPAAGEVDVSDEPGAQAEVSIAADPGRPNVLVAASNGDFVAQLYNSSDSGRSWSRGPAPHPPGLCNFGDPSLAIDRTGRQYFAFLAGSCTGSGPEPDRSDVYVASRARGAEGWTVTPAPVFSGPGEDDKPEIAVGSGGRGAVVVATRLGDVWLRRLVGGSVAGAQTRVNSSLAGFSFASVAAGGGSVVVAWTDPEALVIRIARSGSRGRFPAQRIAARLRNAFGCPRAIGLAIPAQPRRCVLPLPHLLYARGRFYLGFDDGSRRRGRDVYVLGFDRSLRRVLPASRVNPPDSARVSDQFLPAFAADPKTGRLWACYYDTRADPSRRRTRYTCTSSADRGAHWGPPRAVASVASDESRRPADRFEYGEYTGVVVAGGIAHPVWTDSRKLAVEQEEIYTRAVPAR